MWSRFGFRCCQGLSGRPFIWDVAVVFVMGCCGLAVRVVGVVLVLLSSLLVWWLRGWSVNGCSGSVVLVVVPVSGISCMSVVGSRPGCGSVMVVGFRLSGCLVVCLIACLFCLFSCLGARGRRRCALAASAAVCGAEPCFGFAPRAQLGSFVRSFVFLGCASLIVAAPVVVWGNSVLRRHAFHLVAGFGVARSHLWSALFVVVRFGGSWQVWFVRVRVHLQAACCVGKLRAHTGSASPRAETMLTVHRAQQVGTNYEIRKPTQMKEKRGRRPATHS